MSKLDTYIRAMDTLKNLDKIPPDRQMVMLICMKLVMDPVEPVGTAQEALAMAVEKGWVEITSEDAQGKATIRETPAGEEHAVSLRPEDFGLDKPGEPKGRRLTELRGLGKDIWGDTDAQAYVDKERDEWDSEGELATKPIEDWTDVDIETVARGLEAEGECVADDIRASLRQARDGDYLPAHLCFRALERDMDQDLYWKPVQAVYREALAAGKSQQEAEKLAEEKLDEIWKEAQS